MKYTRKSKSYQIEAYKYDGTSDCVEMIVEKMFDHIYYAKNSDAGHALFKDREGNIIILQKNDYICLVDGMIASFPENLFNFLFETAKS